MSVGRNDPCPCKSGKKYKKCCLLEQSPTASPEVIEIAMDLLKKQREEQAALQGRGIFVNYVKPCTYTNPKTGQKVRAWALGNRLFHTRPEYETFHQFIIDHLQKEVLGKDWWVEQTNAGKNHLLKSI